MKQNDDTTPDDTLKAYLDGHDGLSAMYARTASEEPPAALDAAILRAARQGAETVSRPAEAKARQGKWALAASLLLGLGLSSLYYENRALDTQSALLKQGTAPVLEQEDVAVRAFRAAPLASGDAGQAATEAIAEPAAAAAAIEVVTAIPAAPATAPVEIVGAIPATVRPPPSIRANSVSEEMDTLDEITVTGSRIRIDTAPEPVAAVAAAPDWRDTQADWLKHLVEQRRVLRDIGAQQVALQAELDAELEAFRLRYPELDLALALEALEQE